MPSLTDVVRLGLGYEIEGCEGEGWVVDVVDVVDGKGQKHVRKTCMACM